MGLQNIAWLAVFPALGFLVIIHEIGHYWVGRKMGIKIEEFGIGFPPRAKVLFVRKGVPFTLNWLPIGGFVRFAGEESGFDDPDSLLSAPPRRRIPVLLAGVIANILVAMILFGLIFAIWGRPSDSSVSIGSVDANAQAAGFQVDDRLISINGEPITQPVQVSELVTKNVNERDNAPMTIAVERDGQTVTFTTAPTYRPEDDRYLFGVAPIRTRVPTNPLQALWDGITYTLQLLVDMFVGFAMLIGGLFGLTAKPEGSVTGVVGIARITGEAARAGWRPYLELTALLSANLALINILPIPALDGSRIVFALIEAVRRKKIAPEREAFVHAIGMMLLLGLMLLVTVSDVSNIITGQPALDLPPTPTIMP